MSASISPELHAWVLEATGAESATFKQVPGGASREAWFVDVLLDGAEVGLFLRYDRREPRPGNAFATLQAEAEIMAALHHNGALVPKVVASHPTLQAVLLERVGGETWFYLIKDEAEQVAVASDFISRLAEIHRIDPADLAIAALGPVKSAREHVLDEIAAMRARTARRTKPAPLLDFCIDWLERNVPAYDGPVVLVQGDTGPGNFMYADGRVTAVVDWELAHFGDPMDDIAWLSLRAAQEPFTDFPTRLREYAELSGHPVDVDRVWYYRLLAETRLVTTQSGDIDARVSISASSPDAGNNLIYGMFHRRLLIEALARAVGIETPRSDFDLDDLSSVYAPIHAATLNTLKAAAASSTDKLATRYTKSAARLVKYAAEVDRCGAVLDEGECDELEKLLGERPSTVEAGRAELARRVTLGDLDEIAYVEQIWRSTQRDDYLMRTASGALRMRTWPDLS